MKIQHLIIVQLLLLCLVITLVYSPAFRTEPCLLDDVSMLKGLQGEARLDLKSLLIPSSANGSYYRPLIGVSYWSAQTLWHADPRAMHAENVVFHLLNVVLLFWLIRFSLPNEAQTRNYLPFLGALLFAVHPITTESVNWISGRTDLIAGVCLFSGVIALVAWRNNRSRWWLFMLSLLMLAGAIMTKEVAWGFLAVLPFYLTDPHNSETFTLDRFLETFSRLEKLLLLTGIALCFFLATLSLSFWPVIALSVVLGLITLYRKPRNHPLPKKTLILVPGMILLGAILFPYGLQLAKQSASNGFYSKFSRTVLLISLDFDNSLGLFGSAFAFYIKKFFLPLPLSFAITGIAPEYLFAGIAIIILTAFLVVWRSPAAILFLTGLALLLPALPLVHNQIAWTPYAERYIYISTGFWIASLAVGLSSLNHPSMRISCAAICMALIPVAALVSYNRSHIWQTNVALFGDTVQKSPNHLEARVLYMTALSMAGRQPEAVEQFRRIQTDPRSWIRVKYFNDLADRLYNDNLKHEAWEVLNSSMAISLPLGQKHPLKNDDWQKLYTFHSKLRKELFP